MTTVRCPSCGHTHNVPDTEAERLTAALAECQERALRTMKAQQDENERLRAAAHNVGLPHTVDDYGVEVRRG